MSCKPDLDNPLTGPFWRAANEQRLALPHCAHCDRLVWYPEAQCPACQGVLEWRELSGRGSVAAFSVVHRPLFPDAAAWTPYVAALIALEEDPAVRLVSQVVDCAPGEVACDLPVEVCFRRLALPDDDGYIAPMFRPTPRKVETNNH